MARTQIATYAFTAADGTNVSADTTNWAEQDGVNGYVQINGNAYYDPYGATSDCCWKGAGTFTDDQYAEVKLAGSWLASDNDAIGINLRNNAAARASRTMYQIFWQPSLNGTAGAAQVYKIVAGTATQMGANINFAMSVNDLLSAEAVANAGNVDIKVYKNGVLQGTRTDTSSVITGGKPGVTAKGGTYTMRGDDWTAGNVTASASFQSAWARASNPMVL